MAAGLGDEEDADERDEEHEVAAEGEEESYACAGETFARAAASLGAITPVIAITVAAGTLIGWRTPAGAAVALTKVTGTAGAPRLIDSRRCEDRRHKTGWMPESVRSFSLLPFRVRWLWSFPLWDESEAVVRIMTRTLIDDRGRQVGRGFEEGIRRPLHRGGRPRVDRRGRG